MSVGSRADKTLRVGPIHVHLTSWAKHDIWSRPCVLCIVRQHAFKCRVDTVSRSFSIAFVSKEMYKHWRSKSSAREYRSYMRHDYPHDQYRRRTLSTRLEVAEHFALNIRSYVPPSAAF